MQHVTIAKAQASMQKNAARGVLWAMRRYFLPHAF